MYREVEALMRKGAWEEALEICRTMVVQYAGHAKVHSYEGLCLFRLGRFEEAVVSLKRAHELDPNVVDVGTKYAQCLDRLGKYEDAYDVVRAVLPHRPSDPFLTAMEIGLREFIPQRVTDGWQKSVRLDHIQVEFAGEDKAIVVPEPPEPDQYGPRRT